MNGTQHKRLPPRNGWSFSLTSLTAFHVMCLQGSSTRCATFTSPGKPRSPHSVGIVGVKNIRQLNYDDSISPFNIQDEFVVPNFTLEQICELLGQYTAEVGQPFAPEVIETLHKQTNGQPFLVNRAAQILTAELNIPKTETITMAHFSKAHTQLLEEGNTNISHLPYQYP